jgi:hypothetical protein
MGAAFEVDRTILFIAVCANAWAARRLSDRKYELPSAN